MLSTIMHICTCPYALHRAVRLHRTFACSVRAHLEAKMPKRRGVWCMGVACSWCILEAERGDYEEAQR